MAGGTVGTYDRNSTGHARSYWTPPLAPRLAFDLERTQIEIQTELSALVSITDHDTINAPILLRTVGSARHIPCR